MSRMMIKWKHLVVAGLGGVVCGRAASFAGQHPETVQPILACTAGSAVVGVAVGVGVALYRKMPVHIYGLSVGANFALCSFTFLGLRAFLMSKLLPLSATEDSEADRPLLSPGQQEYLGSGMSGGVAGSLASIISRHNVALVAGTGAGGVVTGLLGQWVYSSILHWRMKKAIEMHYPELAPQSRWTLNSFQDWFLGFWHRRSKVSRVESEILILKADIAKEEKRIAALDQELAKSQETRGHSETNSEHSASDNIS